ncbi:MAG: ECF transporter S component [Clostridia bacterium]|nr:ECF transporter S component [Clostridia bacterium]
MKQTKVSTLVLAALFLAVGMILPFLTGQIKEIGNTLLPMHLPVMMCGLVCGWKYGAAVGFILPFLRSVCFGMPPLYPNAVTMAAELCAYGLLIGIFYQIFKKKTILTVYASLILSMIGGRLIWGIAKVLVLGLSGKGFTLAAFWAGGFVDALPGIILQLILIPSLMALINTLTKKKKRN